MATTLSPTTDWPIGFTYFVGTTLVPTTLVPTTIGYTTVLPTTMNPTTAVPATVLPTTVLPTTVPAWERKPWLDQLIRITQIDLSIITSGGAQVNIALGVLPIDITILPRDTVIVPGVVLPGSSIDLILNFKSPNMITEAMKANWVKWSKIGFLDFTIDQSNVAGERPVDWKGWVYSIRKLGDRLVVYGENGVSSLKSSDINWGMTTIYRIGVKNNGAVAGDDGVNFFIDRENKLVKVDTKVTVLDYSEFLANLTDPVLNYDKRNELLYICDGTLGYIYGARTGSFGTGPGNITGIDSQSGILYVSAPGEIVTPKFNICTDIYDFGTRKPKTVEAIEVGSNLTNDLYASIDYRTSYKDEFEQIGWFLVNPGGKAYPRCYGVEFKFRLKSFIREYFELDYLKIKGYIHGYSPLDSVSNIASALAGVK